jgi:hypothetical protein
MVLAIIAAAGVGVALWSTRRNALGGVEWVTNPYRSNQAEAPSADSSPPPVESTSTPNARSTTAPDDGLDIVRVLTTPQRAVVGQMTAACKQAVKSKGAWKDPAASEPWPECVDAAGRPMVVQFCSYLQLSSGEWLPASNTQAAARCRAELPLVRRGKIPGSASR